MTLVQLIKLANSGYPDDLVLRYAEAGGDLGDTLAEFIYLELQDTYDEAASDLQQLDTARQAMETAVRELQGVLKALDSATTKTLRTAANRSKRKRLVGRSKHES